MQNKNLLWRFVALAAIVALAIVALYTKPLKKGIDLAGGSSLTFQVDTSESGDLDVVPAAIDILKQRVDPQGLMNLEWRPIGDDRFEVRMPAGSPESLIRKREFEQALRLLDERNFRLADFNRLMELQGEPREAFIARKVGDDADRAALVGQAAAASDALRQAEQALQAAPDSTQAQRAYDNARAALADATEAVRQTNISQRELTNLLNELYVSPQVAKNMPTNEVQARRDKLAEELNELRDAHPQAAPAINTVVERFQAWASVRGYLDDPADLVRLISRAGVLEFRIAPGRPGAGYSMTMPDAQAARYLNELRDEGPQAGRDRAAPYQWFPVRASDNELGKFGGLIIGEWAGDHYVLLANQPENAMLKEYREGSWKLDDAYPTTDQAGRPAVGFEFDPIGSQRFANLTGAHIGDALAVLLDNEVYSAPRINSQITGRGIIEGRFTVEEVRELVRTLRSGSLPARVNPDPVAVNTIGATLGEANIRRGLRAAMFGLVGVAIFMVIYYFMAGMIADLALALNVLLVLGAMALFNATFTLPGIAGVILTVGIAVDANVLIFERLREEQQKAQSLRMALKNAYDRALSAIVDGNITTLLTCMILAWVGSTEVRGFAMTLGMGILFSLFTALVVSRWVFDLLVRANILKDRVHMMRLVGVPRVNWMGKRYIFWIVSGAMIVIGLGSLIAQGSDVLGIEFRSGTRATVRFVDDAMIDGQPLDDAVITDRLAAAAQRLDVPTMSPANLQVNLVRTDTRVQDFLDVYDADNSGGVTLAEWTALAREEDYFARLDVNADGTLSYDELDARLPEPRYEITAAEDSPQIVREVIDEAFGNLLAVQSRLDYQTLREGQIPALGVSADASGILRVTRELARQADPAYSQTLQNNLDGVLFAFRVPAEEALTAAEMQVRLENTRRQAGREDLQLVDTTVLPLVPVPGSERATAFAVIVRSEDVPAYDPDAWAQFARQEADVLQDALQTERSLESLSNFDPAMTQVAQNQAIIAILLSWAGIIVYLWVRFGSARWGLAAVVCLIHDTIIVVGLVAASAWISSTFLGRALMIEPFKIDLAMIAAILTVIGYSVNDTIVVFDRIRENRGRLSAVSPSIINNSVNQTLSRTLLTSGTTLIVVLVMYIWGGAGIHGFSYALLMGILFGTYSSVAIASPLLLGLKEAVTAKVTAPTVTEPAGK